MPAEPLLLSELNALDRERFVAVLAPLFEGPPWIVAELWARWLVRPCRATLRMGIAHIWSAARAL
jgi:2-oxo-4-hydroxy-4-carboxy--5-ureidoimidazoline (OHCU) decarboxylase